MGKIHLQTDLGLPGQATRGVCEIHVVHATRNLQCYPLFLLYLPKMTRETFECCLVWSDGRPAMKQCLLTFVYSC